MSIKNRCETPTVLSPFLDHWINGCEPPACVVVHSSSTFSPTKTCWSLGPTRILGGGVCSEATPTAAIIFRVWSHQKKTYQWTFTNAFGHLALSRVYKHHRIISKTTQDRHWQATCYRCGYNTYWIQTCIFTLIISVAE